MRQRRYIIAGWSLGLVAVGAASLAFPAIADSAVEQRDAAAWAQKADTFVDAVLEADSFTVESDNTLVTELVALKTDIPLEDTASRDIAVIKTLTKSKPMTRLWADYEMRQHQCLSEAVYYEARSETRSGQIGVAEVVMNRVASKHYPNSICGVVYQGSERRTGCQFSFTCDESMDSDPKGKAWERSKDIATLTLTGMAPKLTNKATHYHTMDVNPVWAPTLRYNGQIGSHKFYRFKWNERPVTRSVNMSVAPPS